MENQVAKIRYALMENQVAKTPFWWCSVGTTPEQRTVVWYSWVVTHIGSSLVAGESLGIVTPPFHFNRKKH